MYACVYYPYLYYVILAGDLHSLLTVLQSSEDGVTSPVDEMKHSNSGLVTSVPTPACMVRLCAHDCMVCAWSRWFPSALPEFELAAHLSMFNLYELIIAGGHTAVLHKPLEAKQG